MENSKSKIFAQFISGIFGGTIVGIVAFLTMTNYGGNNGGCFITAGYESCGQFGAITGMLIGAIIGIAIFSKVKITNYSKAALWLLIGAFLLPFLYGVIMFWPPFENNDLLIVPPVILIFMLFSTIPSLVITGTINWRKFFRHKQ